MKLTKQQEYHLARTYGISADQYNLLRRRQKYRCGVCKRHEREFSIKLSVDHDHVTGKIRGLLCTFCNRRVIGRHRDPELFKQAYTYLKNQTDWVVPPKKKKKKRKKTSK